MNSSQINDFYDIKNLKLFSIYELLSSKSKTNDIPYISEEFDASFTANVKDSENFTDIKMNNNYKNYNEDFNEALNCWTSAGSDGSIGGTTTDDMQFQDDNISHVSSEREEFQKAEQDSSFAQSNAPNYFGDDLNTPVTRYNPLELSFRPPSGSAKIYNFNYPAMSSQSDPQYTLPSNNPNSTMTNDNTQRPFLYDYKLEDISNSSGTSAAASNYSTNPQLNSTCIHPNMWYPNSSFGSTRSDYDSHTYDPQASRDHMADMYHLSNSGREARNRAEKNRRDKLNSYIQELSTMVPHVAESPRRVDKTAVLRFAAHGIRLKYVFGKSNNRESTETTDALMKLLNSFFLTLTCNGQIVLVSSSIEQHLGHCQNDLYGQNILNITHPDDHQMLKEKLIPTDVDNLFDIQPENEKTEPKHRTQAEEEEIDRRLQADKRSFTIRLARSGPRSEPTAYELVKIDGNFRRSDMAPRGLKRSSLPSTLQLMRRSRGREDPTALHTISGNDIVLTAIARIVRTPVINHAVKFNHMEYRTRHLIDGRIVDCDQNISIVAGYMIGEVRNLSPFTFIHQDDVRWVIVALRQMYDCNSSYGESTYRLFTRNGKIIYLHTKGFLEIDKDTNKVHSFICVNTMLDEEEGKRRVEEMKRKFSVIIKTNIPQSLDDVPASENPQQLEKAVLCLIQNLKSGSEGDDDDDYDDDDDDESDAEVFPSTSSYNKKKSRRRHNYNEPNDPYKNRGSSSPKIGRSTKTPLLALVPPATDSIKTSISKSVNVVNTTAAKFLHSADASYSQQQNVFDNDSETDFLSSRMADDLNDMICTLNSSSAEFFIEPDQKVCGHYTAPGAVKRKIQYSHSETDNDEYSVPIQRQAIENALCNSLEQINNRLNQQLNTAMELRDQSQRYEVPSDTEDRIADIMKEHQKQQEIFKNITNEFEVQRKSSENISHDNETLQICVRNILEENQQSHEQHQQHQQQTIQQHSAATTDTSTVETDAQYKTENNLQL